MATKKKDDPKPGKGIDFTSQNTSQAKLLRMGLNPNTGGSNAKGTPTKP